MKTIVIYYSLEGNTREAAEKIAKGLNADILELKPVKEIPTKGFLKFLAGGMQASLGLCPDMKAFVFQSHKYDRIVLGTPVWAGKCAPIIYSFLKKYEVHEKIAAVFTCSGGGDNEGCIKNLKKKLPNMKETIALADRSNSLAAENDVKIKQFLEALKWQEQ